LGVGNQGKKFKDQGSKIKVFQGFRVYSQESLFSLVFVIASQFRVSEFKAQIRQWAIEKNNK